MGGTLMLTNKEILLCYEAPIKRHLFKREVVEFGSNEFKRINRFTSLEIFLKKAEELGIHYDRLHEVFEVYAQLCMPQLQYILAQTRGNTQKNWDTILERLTVQKELSAINNDLRLIIRYPGSQHNSLIHKFYDRLYCLYLTAAHIQFQESEARDSNLTEDQIFDKIDHCTQNNTLQALLNLTSQRAMTTARQMIFKANSQELEIEIEEARKILAYADQQYKIKKPKKLPTCLLTESYFESSITAPENKFVFNVYNGDSNNSGRRNSSSRERSYSSHQSRSRSNSKPRQKYRNNSFHKNNRSRSYDKRKSSSFRNSKYSPHRRQNYRHRSRSNSFVRNNKYNKNNVSNRGRFKYKNRSNSRNNTFHPKAYAINLAEFKNGVPDSFRKPNERYLPQKTYKNSKSPSNRNFCYKCGSSKHFAKKCTEYPQQDQPYTRCSHCGLLHRDRFCKDKKRRPNSREQRYSSSRSTSGPRYSSSPYPRQQTNEKNRTYKNSYQDKRENRSSSRSTSINRASSQKEQRKKSLNRK